MLSRSNTNSREFISLFSGCGGFDAGFKAAGFIPSRGLDNDSSAVENYRRNVGRCELVDLSNDHSFFSRLRKSIGLIIAGPPCQGFSTAGLRDPDDKRNDLLPLTGELCARLRPAVVVVENVAAALSGEHSRHWFALEGRLRSAGYRTHTSRCNAMELGMAQRRRRIFLFAWRTGRDIEFIWPSLVPSRLDHVLSGVEGEANHFPKPLLVGSKNYKIARRIGPGQKLCNVRGGVRSIHTWHIPEVFGRTTAAECEVLETIMRLRRSERRRDFGDADPILPNRVEQEVGVGARVSVRSLISKGYLRKVGKYIDLVHTFNGKFRRFRWDDVACTVDTRFGDPHLFLHPNEHRPFTVREAARIQGFPDQFIFTGSESDQFRLVGNAVPPAMAQAAAGIAKHLLGI